MTWEIGLALVALGFALLTWFACTGIAVEQRSHRMHVASVTDLAKALGAENDAMRSTLRTLASILGDIERRLTVIEGKRWLDMDGNVRRAGE